MNAYEFAAKIGSGGTSKLPDGLSALLSDGQCVRVIILVGASQDVDKVTGWSHSTAKQFLAGYGDADAVYDTV